MPHLIRRQNVKVKANSNNAFDLKQRIEDLMKIMPERFNQLFDEVLGGEEYLQIEQLDINLEGLEEDRLEKDLPERIIRAMKEKIESEKYKAVQFRDTDIGEASLLSIERRNFIAFRYFLETGLLPWWFKCSSHTTWENDLLRYLAPHAAATSGSETKHEKEFRQLRNILKSQEAQIRLTTQFSETFFLNLFPALAADEQLSRYYNSIYQSLQLMRQKLQLQKNQVDLLLKKLKTYMVGQINTNKPRSILIRQLALFLVEQAVQQGFPEAVVILKENKDFSSSFFPGELNMVNNLAQSTVAFSDLALEESMFTKPETGEYSLDETKVKELFTKEGVIIQNAGLIIAAAFLPELFRRCELLKENKLQEPWRAMAVLHYLVWGSQQGHEYEMLLSKILCGIEPLHPIEEVLPPGDKDIHETEEMLNGLIQHWSALKNTSIDGLREAFLQREGKLTMQEGEWVLQVERKTIDILLEHLPWTIGYIRHPWMTKTLRTEWV